MDASKSDNGVKEATTDNNHVIPEQPKNVQDLTQYVNQLLQQMLEKFENMSSQIISRNEMGSRIDDLERNITDLMTQADLVEETVK